MSVTYETTITQTGATTTGIDVPDAVLEELGGGRRPRVSVDVNGYRYATTVGSMDGGAMLSFSAAHRDASGLGGGDVVTVTLTIEEAPQELAVPDDLAAALAASPEAQRFLDGLSASYRKNYITQVEAAKKPETRAKRIAATIAKLEAGQQR